jgi:hypothetical protein
MKLRQVGLVALNVLALAAVASYGAACEITKSWPDRGDAPAAKSASAKPKPSASAKSSASAKDDDDDDD